MSILRSKQIKELYKQHTEAIDLSLNNIMQNISKNFLVKNEKGQLETNPDAVKKFIIAYMNNTWDIPKLFYNYAIQQKLIKPDQN